MRLWNYWWFWLLIIVAGGTFVPIAQSLPLSQWWFWLLVVPMGLRLIGGSRARTLRSNAEKMKALSQEVKDLRAQLSEAQTTQNALAQETHLSEEGIPQAAQPLLAQRVAIILCSDIEGFTSYIEQLGDEAAYELLQEYHRIVRSCVQRHDGVEVKQLGDDFMINFMSAKKALLCAADIQHQVEAANETLDTPLRVRIGIHAGEPIQEETGLVGRTVKLAERIMQQARGGQIYLSEVVKTLVGPLKGFQYVDQGTRRLGGISEPQHLFEFHAIDALSSPLDSQVDRQLESLEKRMAQER